MLVVDYIARRLKALGAGRVFGYQGGGIAPLIEAVGRTEGLEYVQLYQEQGAGFAADAFARSSQKLGVCVATNGPGATNLVSAIANAYFDFSPCVFFTGHVNVADINRTAGARQNGFQETDAVRLAGGITKIAVSIQNKEDVKKQLDKALSIAMEAPKGAVLVELPLDIQKAEIDGEPFAQEEPAAAHVVPIDIGPFIDALQKSKRPVLLIGGGVRNSLGAAKLAKEFVGTTGIPAASSLQGLDVVTSNNIGFSGLYGLNHVNLALYNADLILVLGCRLSKRQIGIAGKYSKAAKIFQVDVNKSELGRVLKSEVSYNCDAADFLRECLGAIKERGSSFDFGEWNKQIEGWKTAHAGKTEFNSKSVRPVVFMNNLSAIIPAAANITLDVGQNQMWCAQGLVPKDGQRIFSSSGLGCMGFSLPASVGACLSNNKKTFAFMGDGGFQMNMQELNAVSARNLPIKIFVFNNNSLGMIQEVQMKFKSESYIGTKIGYRAPNFEGIAAAYGIKFKRLLDERIDGETEALLKNDEPVLFEICVSDDPSRLMNKYDEQEIYI